MPDLYRQNILDHYKNPQNYGEIESADLHAHEANPLCGDSLDIYLNFDFGKVSDVRFSGGGCAISMSAMSMLTEKLFGKTKEELAQISYDDIINLLGTTVAPARVKCAELPIQTLHEAIKNALE